MKVLSIKIIKLFVDILQKYDFMNSLLEYVLTVTVLDFIILHTPHSTYMY